MLRRLGHCAVNSDEEEESQGKLDGPSEKAWGKRKTTFYSTDFVDDELGGEYICVAKLMVILFEWQISLRLLCGLCLIIVMLF